MTYQSDTWHLVDTETYSKVYKTQHENNRIVINPISNKLNINTYEINSVIEFNIIDVVKKKNRLYLNLQSDSGNYLFVIKHKFLSSKTYGIMEFDKKMSGIFELSK